VRGTVRFVGPGDQVSRNRFGRDAYWLRARWRTGYFAIPPRLRGVLPNTVWAAQRSSVRDETLGSGNGLPGQGFRTNQRPVLTGEQVAVREPDDTWTSWTRVRDFLRSGPQDRHYTLDPLTGEVVFGDGLAGALPAIGLNNILISYATGGGSAGNRRAGEIIQVKAAIPYLDSATNAEPATGGADLEPVERTAERGPQLLRHRERAVTVQDVEDLAFAASPEVARAKALPAGPFEPLDLWLDAGQPATPAHLAVADGRVGVVVVPGDDTSRPTPSLGLIRLVQQHLLDRCPAGAGIWVAGPEWIRVTVTATAIPLWAEQADPVRGRLQAALDRYLHPLTGGPDGQGWAFGRKPHRSDLFAVAEAVQGVDHLRSLTVRYEPQSQNLGDRLTAALNRSLAGSGLEPLSPDLRRWLDRALVFSGEHRLTMTLRG
jgi:predicted phage baseplate assembly protein